ncbi:uncharacterized protein PHALS_13018 [Plasmopara halstedii]|uniref:Uncharacterized protein n=1 Tax=Plasmopara halstedii TaxID=4781 RepID=A0A0P1AN25_PLAHL|nr:uncharacterized protein PHALS_13018 [Plasmopara halstedii]CEG42768.1 hypothetical protein PHALS_13018 [Plasmopara halstedii]|eukprot:XP_024579137.1 hypothetical protein PHALS_13018 [Plasmopara halstedii]
MAKIKQHGFATPLLRRSATVSSAAAASAASKLKSNLSTVTKLPTALKRTSATSGTTATASTDCAPSLSRSSTASSVEEETKATSNHGGKFGLSSIMHIRTSFMDKSHLKTMALNGIHNSPKSQRNNDSGKEPTTPRHSASAINTASRFVKGVPTLLRRAVTNNHGANSSSVESPDANVAFTPREGISEDDLEENERHSLLMMLQVPEATISLIPLMAVGEAW